MLDIPVTLSTDEGDYSTESSKCLELFETFG